MRWNKVSIVGVGLLGGSLGQALRKRKLARHVVGCVRREASVVECLQAGAVDEATLDFGEGVAGADLVVLCTPIARMPPLFNQLLPRLQRGAIVTDVGSVKGMVVRELEGMAAKAGVHFVGSHPMAGSDKTGVAAASPRLYEGAVCVVAPTRRTDRRAVRAVIRLWESVGATVVQFDAARHDRLVAKSSHLPHVIASQLVNHILGSRRVRDVGMLCASGFRDTTRIASGSPEMWRDIAIANRRNLARELERFIGELRVLHQAVRGGDERRLARFFEQAKARRDQWTDHGTARTPE